MSGLFRRALATVVAVSFVLVQAGSGVAAPRAAYVAHGLSVPHAATVAVALPPVRVHVAEPPRVRPSIPPASSIRPKVVPGVRPLSGRHVPGPPMLRPSEIDGALKAAAARRHASAAAISVPAVDTARRSGAPRLPGTAPGTRQAQSLPSNPNGSGTGINPWWRYQEESVPGGGHLMVNVGTGNLLLQDDDMSVPHKGIAMAFRRTYNSQSGHNVNATDAAGLLWEPPGMYGNGWTNTFDAHLVRSTDNTVFSVFDIDGARYDYSSPANGVYVPGPGNHNTLTFDGNCGLLWTKKSGTTYYFYRPNPNAPCATMPASGGSTGGYAGRLYQIIGRNRNTYITFSYSWDNGNASATGKISSITAQTESGMTATLTFADVSGYRLLQQITFPDGATSVSYGYDGNGNLSVVTSPANSAAGTRPVHSYGYATVGSDWVISWAASPRWDACVPSCGGDGGYTVFGIVGPSALASTFTGFAHVAVVNPVPNDGTNSALQSGYPSTATVFLYEWYGTGVSTPTFRDSDGHMTNWVVDGSGRPTQTQECTASTNQGQQCIDASHWLVANESWDASSNLSSETDPRGYETDYAYDSNGNMVAVAAPTTSTSAGTFRPTRLYDYDVFNNVIAYCDEKASHANGGLGDWSAGGPPTGGGPDSLCVTNGAAAHAAFTYTTSSAEPFGELTNIRTPLGYNRAIAYAAAQQSGTDFGLPTSVRGDPIAQSDGTRTPFQTMSYDAAGNLVCASSDGNDATTTSILVYDSLNRVIAHGDPDDATVTSGYCVKTPGIGGSSIATRTTYFSNSQVATTQTPAEAATGVSTQFQYDLDGNVTSEQRHYTPTAGPTLKWYDGADRLVEVKQPTDPNYDFYTFPWTTRYLYDLTQGGTVAIGSSAAYHAYGGLFKTQELLPSGVSTPQWDEAGSVNGPSTGTSNPIWQDTAGTAFDAGDRAVTAFRNTGSSLMPVTNTYDGAGNAGLLSQKCNANNECQTFVYDPRGAKAQATFNVLSSSTQYFGFDEDGRVVTASNGAGSFSDVYDADGRKVTRQEAAGSISATISYAYYGDGLRKSLDASAGAQSLPGILTYTYRQDGLLRQLGVASAYTFSFAYTGGRRLTSRSDTTGQSADSFVYTANTSPTSYGLVQSMATPGFYETAMTYNAEGGQLLGGFYSWNGSGFFPSRSIQAAYTSRGEVVLDTSSTTTSASLYANGMRIQTARSSSSASPKSASFQFNAFQSMTLGSNTANTCTLSCVENDSAWAYGYDSGGRQVTASYLNPESGTQYTNTKSYDAEDHLIAQTLPWIPRGKVADQQALGYRWGPLGHPLQIGSTSVVGAGSPPPTDSQYDSLVWDDDDLLFTVNSVGQIDDVKVGDFADYVPGVSNPLTVWDRDVNGQIYGCHAGGAASTVGSSAFQNTGVACSTSSSFIYPKFGLNTTAVGRGGMLLIPKSDGFSDGQNTFQGVRTYDPQAGTWTTPDAYHGDVHDPMSQKPYIWNRNNPYEYSDPSGFRPDELEDTGSRRRRKPLSRGGLRAAHAEQIRANLPVSPRGFRNGLEHSHYSDHGSETGTHSVQEYVTGAQDLYRASGPKTKIDTKSGTVYRLDEQTGNVGIYNSDGSIKSFLNPDKNPASNESSREFFDRQQGEPVASPRHGKKI
jgi:YD repeat-containing protein